MKHPYYIVINQSISYYSGKPGNRQTAAQEDTPETNHSIALLLTELLMYYKMMHRLVCDIIYT